MDERAASMLKLRLVLGAAVENLGGSMRVKGEGLVLRRFRIPIRFLVGLRPAGAEMGVEVFSRGAGERAVRMGRRGEVTLGSRLE